MSELTFRLEAFEGPLDLLLHLISKHKLNIYDIEISMLLDQYLEYIDSLDEQDFDAAGDFLAMAARLVYIKTCSLLPQAEEAEEMKKELQGELIEYSVCKEAAARLRRECVYGDVFVRPPEKIPVNMTFTGNMPAEALVDAYMGMTAKARKMRPVRAEQFSPIVASRIVTVTSKIVYVLKKLYKVGECTVAELYDNITDKSARVATFLAVLELAKSGRIYLNEDNTLICFNKETPRRHSKQPFVDEQPAPAQQPAAPPASAPEVEFKPEPEPVPEPVPAQQPAGSPAPAPEVEFKPEPEPVPEPESAPEPAPAQQPAASPAPAPEVEIKPEPEPVPEPAPAQQPVASPASAPKVEFKPEPEPAPEPEPEPVHITKYALESVGMTHSLAVPVYIEVPAEETAEDLPTPDEIPCIAEIPACSAEQTEAAEVSCSAKDNRFSARCRWGYPAQTSNCWSYWRERI